MLKIWLQKKKIIVGAFKNQLFFGDKNFWMHAKYGHTVTVLQYTAVFKIICILN